MRQLNNHKAEVFGNCNHIGQFICQHLLKSFSKIICILFCIQLFTTSSFAQNATWIWYPGDFEINLANKMQNRRTDRNTFFPPFWKMDAHYVLMDFHKVFDLAASEEITVYAEGKFNLKLDGNAVESGVHKLTVPAGKHKINVKVWNQTEWLLKLNHNEKRNFRMTFISKFIERLLIIV